MKQVVSLTTEGENSSFDRCYDLAGYYKRLHRVRQEEESVTDNKGKLVSVFRSLYNKHRVLIYRNNDQFFDAYYQPSSQASLSVFKNAESHHWPSNIDRRQKKAFRITKGVIIKCPFEDGSGFLEVFTTDWAPFASACAIAIHAQHPLVGHRKDKDNYFTGRFVRHPLTGDLIPVHVAEWVKPNFGTGTVLINPGHDEADLKYARQIGLPIRFSIAPESFDGTPSTWLSPPVKNGYSTKTGFYDGKPQNELAGIYFKKLKELGFIDYYYDYQAGLWPIGRLYWTGNGKPPVDSSLNMELPYKNDRLGGYVLEPLTQFSILSSIPQDTDLIMVTPASEIEKRLLFLRLAYYDLNDSSLLPEKIEIVQGVNESGLKKHPFFRKAAFLGAKTNEISTPRTQLIEQIERFMIHHEKLEQAKTSDIEDLNPTPAWKMAVQALQFMETGVYSRAFSILYKIQKELLQLEIETLTLDPGFRAYLMITYFLLGVGNIWQKVDAGSVYEKLKG